MQLFDYQEADVAFLVSAGDAFLGSEMGLGKSAAILHALRARQELSHDALPALIICPNSVKYSWVKQVDVWDPGMTPYVITGGAAARRKIIDEAHNDPTALVLINYESVRLFSRLAPYGSVRLARCRDCDPRHGDQTLTSARCEVHRKELNGFGFKTVIIDEAHRTKDPKSKQTRAVWAVGHDSSVVTRWALTGTAIANHVGDLWSIMHFIAPDEYPNKSKFVDRYCTPPDAPVWMADGTFKAIGEIEVGDTVIGFEKDPILEKGKHPRLRPAKVLATHHHTSEVLEVTLASGRTVWCTPNHRWLQGWRRVSGNGPRIMQFGEVAIGKKLRPVLTVPPPLDPKLARDAAWLGEIYDGEGSAMYLSQSVTANPDVHAEIGRVLKELDFEFVVGDDGYKILGGRSAYAKFLHYCRPVKRHLTSAGQRYDHIQRMFYGTMGSPMHSWDEIVSIRSLGEGPVVSLTTETETYVVYGYASHNSLQAWNPFGGLDIVGINPATRDEFFKILDTRYRRTPKALVLKQLPHKVRSTRWVEMTPRQRKAYTELDERLTTLMADGTPLTVIDNLTKSTRMLQLSQSYADVEWIEVPKVSPKDRCQCALLGEPEHALGCRKRWQCKVTLAEPSPKLDVLEEIIEEMGGQPLVVAAQHAQLIALAARRLDKAKIRYGRIVGDVSEYDRQVAIDRFRRGDLQIMLMTIDAGGEGVDGLQYAGTMVVLERSWKMLANVQLEARVDRIGSEIHHAVHIIDVVTRDSIEDERLFPRLTEKFGRLEEIQRDRERLATVGLEAPEMFTLDAEETAIVNSDLA